MALKGRKKTEYQREYMRKRRATKVLENQPELDPDEKWLYENPSALASVKRGLTEAAGGLLDPVRPDLERSNKKFKRWSKWTALMMIATP